MTVSRLQTAILVLFFSFLTLAAVNLSKADKELLRDTYKEDQKFFLLNPYLEGDVKGLHVYKIRSDSPPEFHKSWRDVVNPERRLLRGDTIILESVKVNKDHLELRIKTIERKNAIINVTIAHLIFISSFINSTPVLDCIKFPL